MLPKDPNMLLSVVNMKLRDFYPSLADLCEDLGEDEDSVRETLGSLGYSYDSSLNRFTGGKK